MTRSFLLGGGIAILLIAAAPRAAAADQPGLNNSIIPSAINVMGVNGAGVPDPAAAFEVIVRDLANNPVDHADVRVDLTACTDMRISHQSSELVNPALAGQALDCDTKTVSGLTDFTGRVVLSVLGAALNGSGSSAPGPGERCARIYADGVLLGFVTVRVYDQNGGTGIPGTDGVEIADLSRWLADFGSGVYFGRSDYGSNSPGSIGADDFSMWLHQFGLGRSAGGTLGVGFCP